MKLISIYSEPDGLFQTVYFRNGMNIIYGKKDAGNPKASLNSIGKSTFLDLIDFCLLSSHQRMHNPRLFAAKEILKNYRIVLEFSINGLEYKISRSMDEPNIIEFSEGQSHAIYEIDDLKIKLGKLIFKRENYEGIYHENWFRALILFYLKIQKFQKDGFLDPIRYIKEINEIELNNYILYLMGINNSLAYENYKIATELKKVKPTLKEIEEYMKQKYNLKNLTETSNEISKLNLECKKLEKAIEVFKLGEQYEDAEKEANIITKKIKDLLYQNFVDKKRLDSYEDSIEIQDTINLNRVKKIYSELSEDFAVAVKKTLNEAIKFRKELSESRKEFLESEINFLKNSVKNRNEDINLLESERANLFYFLAAKEAITDLTEAFYNLSEKKSMLIELESNTRILNDLNSEKAELESELKKLEIEIISFIVDINADKEKFYEIFQEIYNSIYIESNSSSNFSLTYNLRKKSIIDIDVSVPDMFGKGKNQGRTLIFDLSILINSFNFSTNFPNFLVHDGIFDGVDKAHFIKLYEFIENFRYKGKQVQYITTLNEEGTLSENFGDADKVKPETIEKEAILVLTSKHKLFEQDFDNRIFHDQSYY